MKRDLLHLKKDIYRWKETYYTWRKTYVDEKRPAITWRKTHMDEKRPTDTQPPHTPENRVGVEGSVIRSTFEKRPIHKDICIWKETYSQSNMYLKRDLLHMKNDTHTCMQRDLLTLNPPTHRKNGVWHLEVSVWGGGWLVVGLLLYICRSLCVYLGLFYGCDISRWRTMVCGSRSLFIYVGLFSYE